MTAGEPTAACSGRTGLVATPLPVAGIERQWRAWGPAARALTPQASPEWLSTWAEHFGSPTDTVTVVSAAGLAKGIVALTRRRSTAGFRTYAPSINDELVVASPGPAGPRRAAELLAAALRTTRRASRLDAVDPAVLVHLRRYLPGVVVLPLDWVTNPVVTLSGTDFAQHMAALDGRRRRRAQDAFRLTQAGGLHFELVSDPDRVGRLTAASIDQRLTVWAAAGKLSVLSATTASAKWRPFLSTAARRLAAVGAASVASLAAGPAATPLASVLVLHTERRALMYHRSGVRDATNIGAALDWHLLRACAERGVQQLHTGLGAEEWKYRLGASDRPLVSVVVAPRTVPAVADLLAVGGSAALTQLRRPS